MVARVVLQELVGTTCKRTWPECRMANQQAAELELINTKRLKGM